MGRMNFELPHALTQSEAKTRVELMLDAWTKKFGLVAHWNGDAADFKGKVMGIALDGNLAVLEHSVKGDVTDPGLLFRSQAKKYVERKFTEYLDPAKSTDELKSQA